MCSDEYHEQIPGMIDGALRDPENVLMPSYLDETPGVLPPYYYYGSKWPLYRLVGTVGV